MKKLLLSAVTLFLVFFALRHSFATAQPTATPSPPVYAVLSLIGDKLNIIVARQQTGTRVDANLRESVAISNAVFDDAAVSAIAEAVRKIDPKAELAAINTRSAVLFEKQRELFAQSGEKILIPDAILTALKNQNASHLFLLTKRRDDLAQPLRLYAVNLEVPVLRRLRRIEQYFHIVRESLIGLNCVVHCVPDP